MFFAWSGVVALIVVIVVSPPLTFALHPLRVHQVVHHSHLRLIKTQLLRDILVVVLNILSGFDR